MIVAAFSLGGILTKVIKDKKVKKEIEDIIITIVDVWRDGKLTPEEMICLVKEAKDIYEALVDLKKSKTDNGG